MGRLYVGLGLLAVLLGLSLFVQWGMVSVHEPTAKTLEQAAQAALEEDWQTAHALAKDAQSCWQRSHRLTAAVADHGPMDEADMLYAQLEVYAAKEDARYFAAVCSQLSRLIQAIADAHRCSWWNLL